MSSISYDGIIPTECKCNLPLIEHTSWTLTNPCRRFLVCPNRYKAGVRKCNKFVWYDPELDNSWYREHLYHMYGQLHPHQMQDIDTEIRSQELLMILQDDFARLQDDHRVTKP
ncbi:hypothetical protein Tco_1171875 [Tanacetum coccineum]